VDLFFDNSATAQAQIEGGRVKAIAVSSAERLPPHPTVPTVRENGVDFDLEAWIGYFVRTGTPEPVVARLRAEFDKVLAAPEMEAALQKRGYKTIRLSAKDTETLVARDIEKWTQLIRSAGISIAD
jgi:tripartite-type tricarboxylate transporter receptor subunit TctC